jgi:hypothetical protein
MRLILFACFPYPRHAPDHNGCKVWPHQQRLVHLFGISRRLPVAFQLEQADIIVCDIMNKIVPLETGVKTHWREEGIIRAKGTCLSLFSARCLIPVAKANYLNSSCVHVDERERDDDAVTPAVVTTILGFGPFGPFLILGGPRRRPHDIPTLQQMPQEILG